MLENFFQLTPIPNNQLTGFYNLNLVALSYIVATFASYVALDIAGRIRDVGNSSRNIAFWLIGGSIAMGAGIWSMHFIGMLAFVMPGMAMSYDFFWTGLSMIVAILASGFAFVLLKPLQINKPRMILGGVILGIAIASMHYVGMEGMKINMAIHYLPSLFFLSIIIAIIASEAALYLAIKSNEVIASSRLRLKFISAIIMGAAICGMHYTGMSAAIFTAIPNTHLASTSLNPEILSMVIAGVTFIILSIAFFASSTKEAENQRRLAHARQAGMAEVAASVLHNVGNVLNSVNISSTLLAEKIAQSKLSELDTLDQLISEQGNDLPQFVKTEQGSHLPEYIKLLASEWRKEKTALQSETQNLIRNIEHIKHIISMQQDLSKVSKLEEVVSIPETLNEALFITGIQTNYSEIKIKKEYQNLTVLVDKVKLLQILVNLLSNAKDSLLTTNKNEKCITIQVEKSSDGKLFRIRIGDNGNGIASANLTRIFSYGFTTKKSGHGFGLHSSALAAKDMGGMIRVESKGLSQGAIFTLELPHRTY